MREPIKYNKEAGLYEWRGNQYRFDIGMNSHGEKEYGIIAMHNTETKRQVLRFHPFVYGRDSEGMYKMRRQIYSPEEIPGRIIRPVMTEKTGEWKIIEESPGNAMLSIIHYLWQQKAEEIILRAAITKLDRHYETLGFREIPRSRVLEEAWELPFRSMNLEELTEEYFHERNFFAQTST